MVTGNIRVFNSATTLIQTVVANYKIMKREMNYIINQIDRKINLLKGLDKRNELKVHYQAKLEFYLILILGYLWNKNFEEIDSDEKKNVIETILKPSIGSIISASKTLDINTEFFGNKK